MCWPPGVKASQRFPAVYSHRAGPGLDSPPPDTESCLWLNHWLNAQKQPPGFQKVATCGINRPRKLLGFFAVCFYCCFITICSRSEPHMCRVFSKYVHLQRTVVNSQKKAHSVLHFFLVLCTGLQIKKKPLQFHCHTLGVKGSKV